MGTAIEWTDATWNPVTGCTRISPGCQHCYAERLTATRLAQQPKYRGLAVLKRAAGNGDRGTGKSEARWSGEVRLHPDVLAAPLGWRKGRKIFVCDMADLFHASVPFDFIDRVFAVMALCPQHTFQVLTKRAERMAEYFGRSDEATKRRSDEGESARDRRDLIARACYERLQVNGTVERALTAAFAKWPLSNVWLGCSVENQQYADERIPHLLACPAAVRFLSCEPLLGAVDLGELGTGNWEHKHPDSSPDPRSPIPVPSRLHWAIVGGESGSGARPCDVGWIRSIRDQCRAAGVACFVKQLGARPAIPIEEHTRNNWGTAIAEYLPDVPAGAVPLQLKHSKGGDMAEWPWDLRVREWPVEATERRSDGATKGIESKGSRT